MNRLILPLALAALATTACNKAPPPAPPPVEKPAPPSARPVATAATTPAAPAPDTTKSGDIAPDAVNLDGLSQPLIVRERKSPPPPASQPPKQPK